VLIVINIVGHAGRLRARAWSVIRVGLNVN